MDKPCEWVKVWRLTSFFSLLKSSVLVAAYFFKSPEKRIEWVVILQGKVKKTTKSYEKFHHVSAVKTTESFPSTKLRFSYNFFWLYDFIMLLNLRFYFIFVSIKSSEHCPYFSKSASLFRSSCAHYYCAFSRGIEKSLENYELIIPIKPCCTQLFLISKVYNNFHVQTVINSTSPPTTPTYWDYEVPEIPSQHTLL